MSPEEPKYLPADGASLPEENIQPTPAAQYAAWDRGDEASDRAAEQRRRLSAAPSRSLFGFLEVIYPFRPRFPASLGWAFLYFSLAFLVVVFFWIFAQIIPGVVAIVGVLAWNIYQFGANTALSTPAMQKLDVQVVAPALILGHVAAIGSGLLFLRFLLGPDWLQRLAVRLPSLWHLLLTLLLVPALVILATGVFGVAKEFLPNLGELLGMKQLGGMEKMVQEFGTWPAWLAVSVVGLGPALGEELWCRGLLGLGLFGRNGIAARLLFSSFYFGLLHVDPQQGTMAALMGLVLYFVLVTTRSFWMPMLIHFCINSTSVIGARFESTSTIDQRPGDIPWVVYAGAFALFAAIVCSLYRTHARLVSAHGDDSPLFWEPVYAGLEHPPANSGVLVKRPGPTIIDLGLVALGFAAFVAAVSAAVVFPVP